MGAARKLNFSPPRKSRWLEWIELEAKELEQCELECNGLSWAFSHALSKKCIAHSVMSGLVRRTLTGEAVVPHYWIELRDGWILDLRLRLWLGDIDCVPHGVFHRDEASAFGIEYEGDPELRTGVEYTEQFLDCLTYGMIHQLEFSQPDEVWARRVAMFGIGVFICVLTGVYLLISRVHPGNEWLAKEGAPWVLRRAKLYLCEPDEMIRCTSPVALHGRPDLVYASWLRGLIVVDTKTRMREVFYAQDVVEMSVYNYILKHGYGKRVSSFGYIRMIVGEYRPTVKYIKVQLLTDDAVEHLAGDYHSIQAGEYTAACVCGECR